MAQKTQEHQGELKAIGYELFIAALSILSIANMLLRFFVRDASLEYVIFIINAIMTPIFLGDFLYRFFTAESKSFYFLRGFGWADLFSSLPFPNAKILRLFRLWRVFRLFAQVGARNLIDQFMSKRAENALLTVVFLVVTVTLLPFSIFSVEAANAGTPVTITVLIALLVCLIPTTIGALLSAIKSTASATLLAPSVTFVENIWRQFQPHMGDRQELRTMRITVLVFSALVLLYAIRMQGTSIYEMVSGAYQVTLVGAFVPLVFGLYWSKATTQGLSLIHI